MKPDFNRQIVLFVLVSLFLLSLITVSCNNEIVLYDIVIPAGLELTGAHSVHANVPFTLTVRALDDQGSDMDNTHCAVHVSVSSGSVTPSTIWLDSARTEVELTISASGLVTLTMTVGDVTSGPFEVYIDESGNLDNILAVVVAESLWEPMKQEIAAYLDARNAEGWGIHLLCFDSSATIEEVRNQLRNVGSGLKGAFFVGDLPAAWFAHQGEQFPIDLYFMDLDGTWLDNDGDGMFEDHIGEVRPDIFLGRLDGPTDRLKAYFEKIEKYREGHFSLPERFIAYVDDDWTSFHTDDQPYYYGLEKMLGAGAVDLEYDSMVTTSPDYASRLSQGYQLMQIMAHSDWTLSAFSMSPSNCVAYAHTYLSVPNTTEAMLSVTISDPFKLFLNGALVAESSNMNGTGNDYFDIPIMLLQGSNRLLLKLAQGMYYYSYDNFNYSLVVHDGQWQRVPDLQQQSSPPNAGGALGGYITGWLLAGPYKSTGLSWWSLLNKDFIGGEAAADPDQSSEWVEYQSPLPNINLRDALNNIPNESVAYAYVRVYSPYQRAAQLSLGYKNNGIAVRLNGERIVFENEYDYDGDGYQADRLLVPVTLLAGKNRLLIKVRNWWTNDFAFSVRFLDEAGSAIDDLTYDPEPNNPLDYDQLVQFLVIGVYHDLDENSRFNTDFLGGESAIEPKAGDQYGECFWKKFDSLTTSIDLNNQDFFGLDGGIFTYSMIGPLNPPVHFYNQFNCSGVRYIEDTCMGYNYILDTDYGLTSIGSTKSGSMLNFEDYYTPLSQGKTFGQSFLEWFKINGEDSWSWFYGMTLLGDPTLTIRALSSSAPGEAHKLTTVTGTRMSPHDPNVQRLWLRMKEDAAMRSLFNPALTYENYLNRRQARYSLKN